MTDPVGLGTVRGMSICLQTPHLYVFLHTAASLLIGQDEETAKGYSHAYREVYEASEGYETITVHAHR